MHPVVGMILGGIIGAVVMSYRNKKVTTELQSEIRRLKSGEVNTHDA